MSRLITDTVTLNALGPSVPFVVLPPYQGGFFSSGSFQPAILVGLSSGASLTYNIEVTGDDTQIPTYIAANGLWLPFTGMSQLTASALSTLGAAVRSIRANITTYASGTLEFQFVQVSPYGA